jgi:hypothetical protein
LRERTFGRANHRGQSDDPKENTIEATPKSSETDPPAANQAVGEGDDTAPPTSSAIDGALPATDETVPTAPQVVPGKPDGEVDTRP